jgi:alpha-glucosidase
MVLAVSNQGSDWWRSSVVYQVYPRSFQDSVGDGVGDLEGVRRRLGYLVDLAVDAIWLSPFYPSPMVGFGYDVVDHCDVDPTFGTLDDFDGLIGAAHEHGMRLILDFIPCHTSDRHSWFVESRSGRDSPKRGIYGAIPHLVAVHPTTSSASLADRHGPSTRLVANPSTTRISRNSPI